MHYHNVTCFGHIRPSSGNPFIRSPMHCVLTNIILFVIHHWCFLLRIFLEMRPFLYFIGVLFPWLCASSVPLRSLNTENARGHLIRTINKTTHQWSSVPLRSLSTDVFTCIFLYSKYIHRSFWYDLAHLTDIIPESCISHICQQTLSFLFSLATQSQNSECDNIRVQTGSLNQLENLIDSD
jgi:hypothetical protein